MITLAAAPFRSAHWPQPSPQTAEIGLGPIVGVLLGDMPVGGPLTVIDDARVQLVPSMTLPPESNLTNYGATADRGSARLPDRYAEAGTGGGKASR